MSSPSLLAGNCVCLFLSRDHLLLSCLTAVFPCFPFHPSGFDFIFVSEYLQSTSSSPR